MVNLDVKGMTCGHCAMAVTRAIKELDPKAEVKVDLEHGSVAVDSQAAAASISAAVADAGYEVLGVR
jgi:copper chaperone